MSLGLDGRVAIVTGAARGIGAATARKLHERGATVIGVDILGDQVAATMADLERGSAMTLDVTDHAAVEKVVQEVHERHGRVDILANVAGGTIGAGPGVEADIDDWHRVIALNLNGPFYCSWAVAPIMKAQGWGRIITIGSGAGRSHSRSHVLSYASGKAGAHGLMRQMAVELAPHGVTCNVVAPGLILTELGETTWGERSDDSKRLALHTIPVDRLGKPEEVANAIAFVASEEASYIIGQTIMVDGGHWMF